MAKRLNILSLSGGGFLGLYTIGVLANFEEKIDAPLARSFDLIAGTSIGGIIALALAAEVPAAKILEAFQRNGGIIFPFSPKPKTRRAVLWDLWQHRKAPRYRAQPLRHTVESLFDDPKMKIGDLRHAVTIPAVNLTRGTTQMFKTPHHPTFTRDKELLVVDVAMATSAAPTFFEVALIGNSIYADGGLYANSPDLVALHEAEVFLDADAEVHMLSIGTTSTQFSFSHNAGRELSWVDWVDKERLFKVMIASQQHMTSYMMGHRLQDRYMRLDEVQSGQQSVDLALDIATPSAQSMLLGLADATAQRAMADVRLAGFFQHHGEEPSYFNNSQAA